MFTLSINTHNAAFAEPTDELVRILRDIASRLENLPLTHHPADGGLRDLNGNRVGLWVYEPDV